MTPKEAPASRRAPDSLIHLSECKAMMAMGRRTDRLVITLLASALTTLATIRAM